MFLDPTSLRNVSPGSKPYCLALLLCPQSRRKLLISSSELVCSWDLLFPLQKILNCQKIFPKSYYSGQVLPLCMDRDGPFVRSSGLIRSSDEHLPHNRPPIPWLCSGPPLHGNGIPQDQQPQNCHSRPTQGQRN